MRKFELIPQNGRKSFYGKAIVTEENGNKVLTSYTTDIARIDAQGHFARLWNGYSATTMNHVNSFRITNGLNPISKKEWESMETEERKKPHSDMTWQQSLQACYARQRMSHEHAAPVPDFKKSREYHQMRMIVYEQGGFREKEILSNPHTIERDETWNDQHKVLNVIEAEPQNDSYRKGFAVDLVTMNICG